MGRPEGLSGRPGGGGMGRPLIDSGGRLGCEESPPSPVEGRCVGRIVVGPSGETVRVGTGLGTVARLRTTRGASTISLSTGATGGGVEGTGAAGGADGSGVTLGAATTAAGAADAVELASAEVLVTRGDLPLDSSGWTERRRPSASARRRMRSACASSIDADGLDAPIPNF